MFRASVMMWTFSVVCLCHVLECGLAQTRGGIVRVTSLEVEPYLMPLDKSNPSYHSAPSLNGYGYKGYIVDLLREVARTLNIDFTLFVVPDAQYGHQDYKGRWNGLIGELIGKRADIAAAPLYVTESRSDVVTFTRPFLTDHASLLMRRDKFNVLDPPLRTAPDLLTQNYFRYGTLNHGFIAHAFSTTNDSHLQQVWRNMLLSEEPVFTSTNAEGFARVRTENFIYILPSTIASYNAARPPCDLLATGQFLVQKHFALALQKDSLLTDDVNWALAQLEAAGVLIDLYRKWWQGESDCPISDDVINSHVVGASVFRGDAARCRTIGCIHLILITTFIRLFIHVRVFTFA